MRAIFIVLLIFSTGRLFAQEYQVIHVKGEITREENGEPLKAGEKVSADEKIKFQSSDAMAAVLDPDMGRYILKADPDKADEAGLIYILKLTVTPVRGGMSTRATGINNAFDLKVYFAEETYAWVGEYIFLKISEVAFPLDEENFFSLSYQWKGEQVNKKLGYEENALLMAKSDVYMVEGKAVDPLEVSDYELYYKSANEEPVLITEIDFALIDQESLEYNYEALKDQSKYPFNDIADLFSNMYGKCDAVQVQYNLRGQ